MVFDGPNELKRVDPTEVKPKNPDFGYMVLSFVVNMALKLPINIDPEVESLGKQREAVLIPGSRARAVVIRKSFKTSAASQTSRQRAIVLNHANVHTIRVNDRKIRVPRRGVRIPKSIREWANNTEAWLKGEFLAFTLEPGFVFCQLTIFTPQVRSCPRTCSQARGM